MTYDAKQTLKDVKNRGQVREEDVLALRRSFFEDGHISLDEAQLLFEIDQTSGPHDPAWPQLFVEALTDYVVHQETPKGYVTAENARWLMDRIRRDGHVGSQTELELLIKILDTARFAPDTLVTFALSEVKHAVLSGEGPLASGRALEPGRVGEAEVDLLRRILYAAGGDGNIAITRPEAEILFDINDATVEAENHPAWSDLFVKAVANHLMFVSGYRAPTRQEALQREEWLEERGSTVDFLSSMFSGGFRAVWDAYSEQSAEERALARLEEEKRQIVLAEEITPVETDWLVNRIGRDGQVHDNERALLKFLREESPRGLPVKLKPLLEAA